MRLDLNEKLKKYHIDILLFKIIAQYCYKYLWEIILEIQ